MSAVRGGFGHPDARAPNSVERMGRDMTKFSIGDWVLDKENNQTGVVKGFVDGKRSVVVRWIGNARTHQRSYSARSLVATRPRPFVLEGNLANSLDDYSRTEHHLLRTWLDANSLSLVFKNIHQLSDIKLLAQQIGSLHPPFIHICCHGDVDDEVEPFIMLLTEKIYLNDPKTIAVFALFRGYPVFFSACNLGAYELPMMQFRKATGLGPIAASSREIYDHEAMMFGLMLYQCVLNLGLTFSLAVRKSLDACRTLGIKGKPGHAQRYVRVF